MILACFDILVLGVGSSQRLAAHDIRAVLLDLFTY